MAVYFCSSAAPFPRHHAPSPLPLLLPELLLLFVMAVWWWWWWWCGACAVEGFPSGALASEDVQERAAGRIRVKGAWPYCLFPSTTHHHALPSHAHTAKATAACLGESCGVLPTAWFGGWGRVGALWPTDRWRKQQSAASLTSLALAIALLTPPTTTSTGARRVTSEQPACRPMQA